jgi:hypothetical protein
MKSKVWSAAVTTLALVAVSALAVAVMAGVPADYKGKPWKDTPQAIPGKVWLAYYDVGGEGVAYHDLTKDNKGSGSLNRGPAEKDNFRKDEAVDISYTKAAFDKWKDGGQKLDVDEYYLGWTDAGEWVNCTVDVKEAGTYVVNLKSSAHNEGTQDSIAIDGKDVTGPFNVTTTGDWHTWMMHNGVAKIKLEKGLHLLTFKLEKEGNQNVMWLEFVPEGAAKTDAPKADPKK